MARIRCIKIGLYQNEKLAECSIPARYLFPGLWTLADRAGRLEDRPKRLKAELMPYDSVDVNELLSELAREGFVVRYSAGGTQYIQIVNFNKHQYPHVKEPASTIPAPDSPGASTMQESVAPVCNMGNCNMDNSSLRSEGADKKKRTAFVLPDWVPAEDWESYVEMRQRIRKPMTEKAKEFTVADLDRLRKEGHDPGPVLRQSVKRSWQGVFPVKDGNDQTAPPSAEDAYLKETLEIVRGGNNIGGHRLAYVEHRLGKDWRSHV